MKSMVTYQRKINENLSLLLESMNSSATTTIESDSNETNIYKDVHTRNKELWDNIQSIMKQYLFDSDENEDALACEAVWDILKRLVNYDPTLTFADFKFSSHRETLMKLYRLLLKGHLVVPSTGHTNSRSVQLIDFLDTDVS